LKIKINLTHFLLISLFTLWLTACSAAAKKPDGSPTVTPNPSTATPEVETPTPTLEPVETADSSTPCAYQWATQDLPEISDQLLQAFKKAGLNDAKVRAEAYGENCVMGSGKVRSFSTMETDFRISVGVADLADQQALGAVMEQILLILDQYPVGSVPGPQPGYIGIEFTDGGSPLKLWFKRTDADAARQKGLLGAGLFRALSNP
jgi:hypothetical protein